MHAQNNERDFFMLKRFAVPGWVLLSLLCFLVACGSTPASTTTTGNPSSGPQIVKVSENDFSIQAATTQFVAGQSYTFQVTNSGTHHHDFLIMHPGQTELLTMDQVYAKALTYIYNIAPGQTKTLTYTFKSTAPSGMLEFACHYGGHYEAGMHQAIVVNSPSGETIAPYANNAIPVATSQSGGATAGKCDPPVTVKLGAGGAFDQQKVSLKAGDTLVFVNTTKQTFTVTTKPDAGIAFTVIDPEETQPTLFPNAGTFLVSSMEDPQNTMTVTTTTPDGVTCGYTPVATLSFDANYTNPAANQYFFTPASVTLTEGQSITLSNLSDQDLTFTIKPDADLGDIKLDKNEHQLLLFSDDGTYSLSCVQYPGEHVTIVVNDND